MTELAYDERTVNFHTTNAALFATTGVGSADPVIGGLEVTVVGTGAPVVVEFFSPAMGNALGQTVSSYFVVTVGAAAPVVNAATGQFRNWITLSSTNHGGSMRRRLVLTNGVSYTFRVGLAASSGITTAYGSFTSGGATTGVMHLRVTD